MTLVILAVSVGGCGKKGPPLPPLVRIPVAPAELLAERRGPEIDIEFTVPANNIDGSRPANVRRVDVYAYDGAAPPSDSELLKKGRRIGSVDVKSPRDPNATVDADDPDAEPLQGQGLDQGARAHLLDRVEASTEPAESDQSPIRTYVGVAINTKGRQTSMSQRAAVPLVAAPAAPSAPAIQYDEQQITVSWQVSPEGSPNQAFFLYDAPHDAAVVRVTAMPVNDTMYVDTRKERLEWGAERCYAVSAVKDVGGLSVESSTSPAGCVTLKDTFPPKAPTGLTAVPQQGAISLIWNANSEADLAGYLVLRGGPGEETLTLVTPDPIEAPSFQDSVESGRTVVYAIQAVDKAGNKSEPSARLQETAR